MPCDLHSNGEMSNMCIIMDFALEFETSYGLFQVFMDVV